MLQGAVGGVGSTRRVRVYVKCRLHRPAMSGGGRRGGARGGRERAEGINLFAYEVYVLHLISGHSPFARTSRSAARRQRAVHPHRACALIDHSNKKKHPSPSQRNISSAAHRASRSPAAARADPAGSHVSQCARCRAAVRGSQCRCRRSAARASRLSLSGSGPCPPDVTAPRPPAPLD